MQDTDLLKEILMNHTHTHTHMFIPLSHYVVLEAEKMEWVMPSGGIILFLTPFVGVSEDDWGTG